MTGDAYDKFCQEMGQCQPENICKLIGPGQIVDLDPSSVEILDVGAGTGTVGMHLGKKGFSGIIGLDPS